MKERPINLKSWEVRAILDGRKTQLRRLVKPQPAPSFLARGVHSIVPQWPRQNGVRWFMRDGTSELVKCPYGQPGDRLWVRETWAPKQFEKGANYRSSGDLLDTLHCRWEPSIHMPRWASRITLEIEGVRVERLNEISEEDAEAEGAENGFYDGPHWEPTDDPECAGYADGFRILWESINGPGSWDANPWVWVVTFRRV